MFSSLRESIRRRYQDEDILVQKKSVLLMYTALFYVAILILIAATMMMLSIDRNQKMSVLFIVAIGITGGLLSLLLLRFRSYMSASVVLIVMISILFGAGLAGKYVLSPHTGFGMLVFSSAAVVFAALFTNITVTTLVAILLMGYNIAFYTLVAGLFDGGYADTVRNVFIDGVFAIVLTYFFSVMIIKTMTTVIDLMRDESERNRTQYDLIKSLFQTCGTASEKLSFSSEEMTGASERLSTDAQGQAASLEEITSTMNELHTHFSSIEQNTIDTFNVLLGHLDDCRELSELIINLREGTSELTEAYGNIRGLISEAKSGLQKNSHSSAFMMENSGKVGEVVTIINDFFERINLLSLNASIEAARAGEFGRGFAVVADEIGKLADQSAANLKEITELIETNNRGVEENHAVNSTLTGVVEKIFNEMGKLEKRMGTILERIEDQNRVKSTLESNAEMLKKQSEEIKFAAAEQRQAIEQVTSAVGMINDITQSNASYAEELATISRMIMDMAKNLTSQVLQGQEG